MYKRNEHCTVTVTLIDGMVIKCMEIYNATICCDNIVTNCVCVTCVVLHFFPDEFFCCVCVQSFCVVELILSLCANEKLYFQM